MSIFSSSTGLFNHDQVDSTDVDKAKPYLKFTVGHAGNTNNHTTTEMMRRTHSHKDSHYTIENKHAEYDHYDEDQNVVSKNSVQYGVNNSAYFGNHQQPGNTNEWLTNNHSQHRKSHSQPRNSHSQHRNNSGQQYNNSSTGDLHLAQFEHGYKIQPSYNNHALEPQHNLTNHNGDDTYRSNLHTKRPSHANGFQNSIPNTIVTGQERKMKKIKISSNLL